MGNLKKSMVFQNISNEYVKNTLKIPIRNI